MTNEQDYDQCTKLPHTIPSGCRYLSMSDGISGIPVSNRHGMSNF